MKAPSSFQNVFIHREPVDMRRGIDGLCAIVQAAQMGDLVGRNIFVFRGRRRDRIKVLYFDRTGFCLWQKRLETDKFPWPKNLTDQIVQLSPQEFSWLLEGFDVWKIKPFREATFHRVG